MLQSINLSKAVVFGVCLEMEIPFLEQQLLETIAEQLSFKLSEENNTYILTTERGNERQSLILATDFLEPVAYSLRDYEALDDNSLAIASTSTYETAVRVNANRRSKFIQRPEWQKAFNFHPNPRLFFGQTPEYGVQDEENGITYDLSPPSNEFIIFLFDKKRDSLKELFRSFRSQSFRGFPETPTDFFEFAKFAIGGYNIDRYVTAKVQSTKNQHSKEILQNQCQNYLYQISYQLGIALIEESGYQQNRIKRHANSNRFQNLAETIPYQKNLKPELLHHYHLALSSNDPSLEFLSYYHIIEHFFYDAFYKPVLNKNKENLEKLLELNQDSKEIRGDITRSLSKDFQFNEKEALLLVLKEYVKLGKLKNDLSSLDDSLIEYLQTHSVSFTGDENENKVSFNDTPDHVYHHIKKRIYDVRNSIVHSKSSTPQYRPFFDDEELVEEIPLIKCIAEQIIISSAEDMETESNTPSLSD